MTSGLNHTRHIPVMPREVQKSLRTEAGGVFLDCTLGGGGHTRDILEANAENTVFVIDRDKRALERTLRYLESAGFASRVEAAHAAFSELSRVCSGRKFNGMLADLGVSSDQLYEKRGFSFADSASLDMRMDETRERTASAIVNNFAEDELFKILKRGGVGREAHAVAKAIVRARPISTTRELADIITRAARGLSAKTKINPATVSFQAIRMTVNAELDQIEQLLEAAPGLMQKGGRFAVITFHSLEDKLVTRRMREWEHALTAPAWWPGAQAMQNSKPLGTMVEKKAVTPSAEEIERNPSSRSARLRVFEFSEVQ